MQVRVIVTRHDSSTPTFVAKSKTGIKYAWYFCRVIVCSFVSLVCQCEKGQCHPFAKLSTMSRTCMKEQRYISMNSFSSRWRWVVTCTPGHFISVIPDKEASSKNGTWNWVDPSSSVNVAEDQNKTLTLVHNHREIIRREKCNAVEHKHLFWVCYSWCSSTGQTCLWLHS